MSLSVIVPAYNEANHLPTLLSSLHHARRCLHDRFPDYPLEVIVVDNASSDETGAVALSYAARVISECKRNVSAARNRGVSVATGKYLVFIDADYRVEGNFLSQIAAAFEKDERAVALGVKVVVEHHALGAIQRSLADFALLLLRRITAMSFGVFAFQRAYFEHLRGFNEGVYAYEDVELHNLMKRDLCQSQNHYRVLHEVRVHASARGFHRGGMLPTYLRMTFSRRSRRDPKRCRYWYDR